MKTQLLAAGAILALAASAPACAQTIGSVGASANHADYGGYDQTQATLDGSVALPFGAWTLTANASETDGNSSEFNGDIPSAAVHLTTRASGSLRLGGFVALSRPNLDTDVGVGVEATKYLGKVTLNGLVAYGHLSRSRGEMYSARGEARYFVTDDFRLDGGLGYSTLDSIYQEEDVWDVSAGGEYKLANTGWSVFGKYAHFEADRMLVGYWSYVAKTDVVRLGLRYTFGGSLKARDAAGADLIDGEALFRTVRD